MDAGAWLAVLIPAAVAILAAAYAAVSAAAAHRQAGAAEAQATSARKQAEEAEKSRAAAERQADSAKQQAEEATKSREIAEKASEISQAEYRRNIAQDQREAQSKANESILAIQSASIDYGMNIQQVGRKWHPHQPQTRENLIEMIEQTNSGIAKFQKSFMENMGYLPPEVQRIAALHIGSMAERTAQAEQYDLDHQSAEYSAELVAAGQWIVRQSMTMLSPELMNKIMNFYPAEADEANDHA